MVSTWIGAVVGIVALVIGIKVLASPRFDKEYGKGFKLTAGIGMIVIGLMLSVGGLFLLYGTEDGARAQKTMESETGGGLTRVVTVYDMQGDQIAQYEGKLDVDADEKRIIFDIQQPDGTRKRVQIWSSTGTVIIQEK